jgi:putative ABC transport system ATP-binding protein
MQGLLYKLRDITCSFNGNAPVLSIGALDIPKGKVIAVLGESGSGKSTLLNILGRLYPSDVTENASALFYPDSLDRPIDLVKETPGDYCSFIFQNSYLFESGSVTLNLDLMDIIALNDEEFQKFLEQFGMPTEAGNRISARVRDLSGGQKRRLALMSALLRNRDTILADELTSDLDPIWAEKSLTILKDWQRETDNRTIIWVTHNYEQALEYADIVLFLTPDGEINDICLNEDGIASPIDWPTKNISELKKIVANTAPSVKNTTPSKAIIENINPVPPNLSFGPADKKTQAINNYSLAASLAVMTSFEPGRNWLEKFQKIKIFTHIFVLSIILTLATLAFGVWSFVGADVERQKQDPQTQHFVVVQNMRAANTRLRQQDLDQLDSSLISFSKSSASPFEGCMTSDQSEDNASKVFGRLDQIESVLLTNLDNDRPITRRARLLLLDPLDPLLACMKTLSVSDRTENTQTLGSLMQYPDELKIALSQQFYDQVILEGSVGNPDTVQFARGYDAKGPSFEIAGLMPVAPYNDRFAIDGVSTTEIFKTWRSITGENSLKDFDAASVYFTEDTAKDTIAEMKKRNYIFNVEAYNKFSSIVELRNVIEDGFKIFALIVIFSILSTIGFLAWLFLSKFAQPIGILAAHNRPTRIVLYAFLTQIMMSLGISVVVAGVSLFALKAFIPALGNIVNPSLFGLAFIIVSISAIIGSIGSFMLWSRANKYPMQMLRM